AAGALVLLDELGAATDPLEGGALACAVLEALAAIPGSLTLATTHLGTVKTFAQEQAGMLNAAVRFNAATLAPEYRLDAGQPGASQALAIAARTGFPAALLERARSLLSADHLRLETLIATVEDDRRRLAEREQQLAESLAAVTRDRASLTAELAELRAERRRLLHEASQQAAGIVANAQRDVSQLLRETRQHPPADGRAEQQLRDRLRERGEKLQETVKTSAPKPSQPLPSADLVPGRTVWVASLDTNAVIERVSDDRHQVTVETGGLHVTVDAAALGRRNNAQPSARPAAAKLIRPRPPEAVPGELNLVGKRVEEALPVLDHYLDQAAFSGRPEARIVHGFGSGRLQAAVHDFLRGHPLVGKFRLGKGGTDLGGGGITLVTFRRRD
ncbi:MAG: Smr/MutS family protein, partial [Lentisphaeria bacterium]